MTRPSDPLAAVAAGRDPGPFALVRREGADHVDLFTGPVRTADRLADLPLPDDGAGPRTLALVPFRQVTERGFECVDDGMPLEFLTVEAHRRIPLAELLGALPDAAVRTTDAGFDIADDEYAAVVDRVLADEIGRGEGANFVIHRTMRATVQGDPLAAALAALRRLLLRERGAYWTFLVYTGARILVGASPERHVSVADGLVEMNPISGTFRHRGETVDRAALLRFLHDPKEVEELYMVLDEELKMMAVVAEHGGQVVGPYLKEMAHLAHTEYLLAGRCSRDVRDVLRETMFAPTVTGSPMENACRVIARHERAGRRYYAGRARAARPRRAGPADAGRADPDPDRRDLPRGRAAGAGRRHAGPALDHRRGGGRDAREGGGRAGRARPRPGRAGRRRRAGRQVRRRPGGTRRAGRPQRAAGPVLAGAAQARARSRCAGWPDGGR